MLLDFFEAAGLQRSGPPPAWPGGLFAENKDGNSGAASSQLASTWRKGSPAPSPARRYRSVHLVQSEERPVHLLAHLAEEVHLSTSVIGGSADTTNSATSLTGTRYHRRLGIVPVRGADSGVSTTTSPPLRIEAGWNTSFSRPAGFAGFGLRDEPGRNRDTSATCSWENVSGDGHPES